MRIETPQVDGFWPKTAAKFVFSRQRRPIRHHDEIVTAFRDGEVTLRRNRRTDGFTNALVEHGYQGIREGDLVIHSMDAFAGAVGVSDSDGKASPVVLAYRAELGDDPRFFAYWLRSMSERGFILSLAKGIRQRSSSFDAAIFEALRLPHPDTLAQRRIAEFLDRETERIDALINKKRRLIDLLEEKRAAAITQAVTKGLDPTAPMKDSGIPWIGQIPAPWGVAQLRHALTSITDGPFGSALTSSHYSDSGARVVRLGNIGDGVFENTDRAYIPMAYYEQLKAFALGEGDLVMAGLGDDRRGLGRAVTVPRAILPAIVKADCYRLRVNLDIVDGAYVSVFLSSSAGSAGAIYLSRGTTRQRINTSIARELPILLPPMGEQTSIVEHVMMVRSLTERATASLAAQLSLLAEYREALITAAVTGEIDIDTFNDAPQREGAAT